jgi:hypothetical protein
MPLPQQSDAMCRGGGGNAIGLSLSLFYCHVIAHLEASVMFDKHD